MQLRFELPQNLSVFANQLGYFNFEQFYSTAGFWVPITALTDGVRGTWNVYTLDTVENSDLYTLNNHPVEVLHAEEDKAFIRASLDTGQLLLQSGLHRLVPGQIVKLADNKQARQ